MKIKSLETRAIFDSRGESTIEVALEAKNGSVYRAQVPSGKSRGSNEAAVLSFPRVKKAEKTLRRSISKGDFKSIQQFDRFLIKADSTANKSKLGGNFMVGSSIAFTKALAAEHKEEVWQTVHNEFFKRGSGEKRPFVFSNLINGGEHANNNLDIQEYMVVVSNKYPSEKGVSLLIRFYKELGEFLRRKFHAPFLAIGDEGGYSADFENNFEPIGILGYLIKRLKMSDQLLIALDAAASNFYHQGKYIFDGRRMSSDGLGLVYDEYFDNSTALVSIEDPFAEEDYYGFALLRTARPDRMVAGDDLTVTNPRLIAERTAAGLLANAVIIKPNQVGTVSEACEAIKVAHANGLKCIVSHRSGETEDAFVIHLAKAAGAFGLKIGAPARERMIKFNEFTRIYN
ncbi:hypothetical protein M1295_00500 [Patescibacteria group bacterium]|nr:hypothetical protein [Patescibacteria group bacterium]